MPRRHNKTRHRPRVRGRRPNILVIWGDDIGITNITAYKQGADGYKTPNIERIATKDQLH